MGSELYEYRIYPSTTNQSGSSSNEVSLRAKPKAPACISGYVVHLTLYAGDPIGYCSAYNTSECGGLPGGGLPFGGQPLGGEGMMQAIGEGPGGGVCQKTNMLVVEWDEPENQVLGVIQGYSVVRFDDEEPPWYTYGDLTNHMADTMCSELSSENFYLSVITVDVYGDTSLRTPFVQLATGSIDYCGGVGTPQTKLASEDAVEAELLPEAFALHQNHPNPFNAGTVIRYELPVGSNVSLDVFDVLGGRVVTLAEGFMAAGTHALSWDGRNSNNRPVASGMYFYRLVTDGFTQTKKLVVLK